MISSKLKKCLRFEVLVQPSKGKKAKHFNKMVFKNIGNFGKKLSEYNEGRREKNMEKLRLKAQKAEADNKRLEEEKLLRKSLDKNAALKKEVKEQKTAKLKSALEGFNKLGEKFEKNSKEGKFDVLGNQKSKKQLPEMFGNNKNNKFKL